MLPKCAFFLVVKFNINMVHENQDIFRGLDYLHFWGKYLKSPVSY